MKYFVKTPWWLKMLYPRRVWHIPTEEKIIYFTFDDGPHPTATPFVLEELKRINAKATFFCVGNNVFKYPEIYQRIISEGHSTGNHTHKHLNGWKTKDEIYLGDIAEAANFIQSSLFRPPYGRITSKQVKELGNVMKGATPKVIMWSVLSGDFDQRLSKQKCLDNVLKNTGKGSIVVFHDSEKSFEPLQYVLPRLLQHFHQKGFKFERL